MPSKRSRAECSIYFLQVKGGGPIKVGASKQPLQRIQVIQTWCPLELELICEVKGSYFIETVLHELLKPFCIRGEWYEPNEALNGIISYVLEHAQLPQHLVLEVERRWAVIKAADLEAARRWNERLSYGIVVSGYEPARSLESREKMSASAIRRHEAHKASLGNGRALEFEIVAKPKSAD